MAVGLFILAGAQHGERVHEFGRFLGQHATGALMLKLAEMALSPAGVHRVRLGALALLADGLFTLFEGYALVRRWTFAPWLVVIATASFIPWEIARLIRVVHLGRVVALVLNLAVVAYLAYQALHDRALRGTT